MLAQARRIIAAGLLAIMLGFGTGCSTMNNTEKGVLAGGAIGAGAGTLIGAATGNPKTGAVVGGLLGAGVGGLAGDDADRKQERRTEIKQANMERAYDNAQPNRISEVVDLVQSGTPEQQVINHIKNKAMTFDLSAADLKYLNENRVPTRVIEVMQSSRNTIHVPMRSRQPTIIREEVIVEPVYVSPPPPVVFVDPYARPGFHMHGRW
jgi:hypothetical protein